MTVDPPTTPFLPRKYQEEIFAQAQKANIIAALDTGSGKTFISTLLVKWVAAQNTAGKKIFFFVPKVPLVEQQGDFIARHSALRVLKLHGSSNIDITDRNGWKLKFAQHDVFIMTAQIFLNFLTHSILKMQEVSLMVFDECHHARKKHPYAIVMEEYRQCPAENRPKVFGMTASPIWNAKNPTKSLEDLEATLDAKVIGVREHLEELSENAPKPTEVMKLFPAPPEEYNYPSPLLWEALSVFDLFRPAQLENSPWPDIERRYFVTLNNLGPYAGSLYLFTEMSHLMTQLFAKYRGADEIDSSDIDIVVPRNPSSPTEIPTEFFDIADVLVDYQSYFVSRSLDSSLTLPVSVALEWCSPKVRTLVWILLEHHSPTFQGIVFVEQRQIAACLARLLPHIPVLNGLVKCEALVGAVNSSEGLPRDIELRSQDQIVRAFRQKEINLIIATSVAEEGLDFPACDVVIRFDSLDHLVGYVQSRGRARNKSSNFIIMVQQDNREEQEKYQKFMAAEPKLREAYQLAQLNIERAEDKMEEGEEREEEDISLVDLQDRERYTVPSTSAFVTYDNAISLIGHLCSLIPRDLYTAQLVPVYTGDFQSTLYLPASLPLPPTDLVYIGPKKSTKKESKRAVSFLAVKRLHQLDVFDDYLLPAGSGGTKDLQDAEGKAIPDMSHVSAMINVDVRDPWIISSDRLWVHPIVVDGEVVAGLVTGTQLVPVNIVYRGNTVQTLPGRLLESDPEYEEQRIRLMEDFTKLGILFRISASPYEGHPSMFIVPLTLSMEVDFDAMEKLVFQPRGISDWSSIGVEHYEGLLVRNANLMNRVWLLRRIRDDLTPMSIMTVTAEGKEQTYRDYYAEWWSRKNWTAYVPDTGPMLEVSNLSRSKDGEYYLGSDVTMKDAPAEKTQLFPQGCCSWYAMPYGVSRAFAVIPVLAHRITDIYRVRAIKFELGLPPMLDDLMVQALTIPSARAGFNNQRLETLGDAVLEVCTTVHLLNKFPHRHEGQLDILRQRSICNRFLLYRALDAGLDRFVTSESSRIRVWRHVVKEYKDESNPRRYGLRNYPRRSLQDCMEATLGAAFITGGIPMALQAGTALGLVFGGPNPWAVRYTQVECAEVAPVFMSLQERLGYTFRNGRLLREALTHPSFASVVEVISSYQRLEFLGDAILNLVVVHYLYNKYPKAGSDQLALPRTKAVCSQALAFLAVNRLDLHRFLLVNNVDLNKAIDEYVPHLQDASPHTIINTGWKFDPPKVLSDVFESVIGAVLVDSGYNYEMTAGVVEGVMEDILSILSPAVRLDPITTLLQWVAASSCQEQVKFSVALKDQRDGMQVELHGVVIAGPIVSASLVVAKNLAAERALAVLQSDQDRCLSRVCVCGSGIESRAKEENDKEVEED
ncbi:hypothetical protein GYMLUDRAFT_48671, partial [Collybiopsis luxurians FD-317 M1]